ncbi:hypothetical protein E4U13_008076 [Claviceps humidiphila]|uniref:Uncharacterized protein n=2 Tax=Claviceps TaxID=5110 RepID=A0A9P7N145_9HYPO|nr:hypothetical protein E4U57_008113 [Claviceps arundinis]KAG5988901.1 hypothetical protein E4U52_006132 [Claviceps spartinae]KAG6060614.1 hypothetical protein E4U32_003366 [Claviceps aff. humidiphila group G2b]KAG6087742.1 hypothetical protein E4U15_007407 [Claviceps sp. LM218 group G6]KAG6099124.1 hypothetical protein E4U30_007078 [Claviceps sp. LM220 group G6]KAG6101302.1 hypothetical protein E4U31_003720 [Claviceps sp. LM219 group G6]KAG6114773.1 hypothetical protein E4U14_001279 [Clavice
MDSKDQNKKDKNEKQFSILPIKESDKFDPKFAPHQAHPGPAMTENMPAEEGSKSDRQERKEELNK